MTWEDKLRQLGDGTAKVLAQLWAAVESGTIPRADFPDLAAELVAVANARGASAARAAFNGYMEVTYAAPAPVAAAPLPDDRPRLREALTTILAAEQDTAMQLTRLATNEPVSAAMSAYGDAMAADGRVTGWRRGLESDACELCTWWWREGRVWRSDHPMPRHVGCVCHQVPVVDEQTRNYQSARQAADRARERRSG